MSLHRLCGRVARLEAQQQAEAGPQGQGLASLLADARRHGITGNHVPLASLTPAELDAKIADLTAQVAAGARGFTQLLLDALVLYRQPAPQQEPRREPLP